MLCNHVVGVWSIAESVHKAQIRIYYYIMVLWIYICSIIEKALLFIADAVEKFLYLKCSKKMVFFNLQYQAIAKDFMSL